MIEAKDSIEPDRKQKMIHYLKLDYYPTSTALQKTNQKSNFVRLVLYNDKISRLKIKIDEMKSELVKIIAQMDDMGSGRVYRSRLLISGMVINLINNGRKVGDGDYKESQITDKYKFENGSDIIKHEEQYRFRDRYFNIFNGCTQWYYCSAVTSRRIGIYEEIFDVIPLHLDYEKKRCGFLNWFCVYKTNEVEFKAVLPDYEIISLKKIALPGIDKNSQRILFEDGTLVTMVNYDPFWVRKVAIHLIDTNIMERIHCDWTEGFYMDPLFSLHLSELRPDGKETMKYQRKLEELMPKIATVLIELIVAYH